MKVDVHNHAIPTSVIELFESDSSYGVTVANSTMRCADGFEFPLSESFYSPKAKLEELSAHGLDGAIVSIAPPAFLYDVRADKGGQLCVAANEGLARFAAASPQRLRWMAHVPLQDVDRAITILRRAKASGAVGVEIATSVGGVRPDAPPFEAFWAAAQELRLIVMLHPYYNASYPGLGDWYLQNVIGNPLETMIAGCRLICAGILDQFPDLEILLVHGGGHLPYQLGRLRHAISVRPELSAAPADPWIYARRLKFDTLTHDAKALAYMIERVGSENVFVGTDLPFDMAPPRPVEMLRSAVSAETAERIAEINPAVLFERASVLNSQPVQEAVYVTG